MEKGGAGVVVGGEGIDDGLFVVGRGEMGLEGEREG